MVLEHSPGDTGLDQEGFLLDYTAWTEAAADRLALVEDITLTPAHWEVINLLRNFYQEFDSCAPELVEEDKTPILPHLHPHAQVSRVKIETKAGKLWQQQLGEPHFDLGR